MIDRADLDGAAAVQMNAIVGEARRQADLWQVYFDLGREDYFAPPLFAMPGVELPIVPRVVPRLPRVQPGFGRWAR